jgi:hypothetical protein
MYRARRRRLLLGAVLALMVVATVFAAAHHSPNDKDPILNTDGVLDEDRTPAEDRSYVAAVSWPQQGQAAFVLGNARPAASPHQQPAPIASLAKVMTAYLILERYPLSGAQEGFTITVTAAEAQAEAEDAAQDQSVAAVQVGEQLTERQLLEALLIPSLITAGYAGKTGSDFAAGACLAFFTTVTVGGRRQTAVGVVMGQWKGNDTSVILAAAGQAAQQLVESVSKAILVRRIAASGAAGG